MNGKGVDTCLMFIPAVGEKLSYVNDKSTKIFGQDCGSVRSSRASHAFTQITKSKVSCQCLKKCFIFNLHYLVFHTALGWRLRPIYQRTAVAFRPADDLESS